MARDAKDMLGNRITVGDFVRLNSPEHCLGRIVAINPGSSLAIEGTRKGGVQPKITEGVVVVEIIIQTNFDPRDLIATQVLKVEDPMPPEEKAKRISKLQLATQ